MPSIPPQDKPPAGSRDTTLLLQEAKAGSRSAAAQLLPMVYDQLRAIAGSAIGRENPGHTLQPTALVHEVYLKLVDQTRVGFEDRAHFMSVAAMAMRRILVDHARGKKARKRGGGEHKVALDQAVDAFEQRGGDLVALHEAMEKLAEFDPQKAKIVELKFFGGMTSEETAAALGVSLRTIERDWALARAWLRGQVEEKGA